MSYIEHTVKFLRFAVGIYLNTLILKISAVKCNLTFLSDVFVSHVKCIKLCCDLNSEISFMIWYKLLENITMSFFKQFLVGALPKYARLIGKGITNITGSRTDNLKRRQLPYSSSSSRMVCIIFGPISTFIVWTLSEKRALPKTPNTSKESNPTNFQSWEHFQSGYI